MRRIVGYFNTVILQSGDTSSSTVKSAVAPSYFMVLSVRSSTHLHRGGSVYGRASDFACQPKTPPRWNTKIRLDRLRGKKSKTHVGITRHPPQNSGLGMSASFPSSEVNFAATSSTFFCNSPSPMTSLWGLAQAPIRLPTGRLL